jgi:TetR/AcrR family transcriptional regulator, cholesterol catabolism regulator
MTNSRNTTSPTSTTKDQLLQVAVRLFSEHGYGQTSLQQLVEAAGLTKGAFYHYFDTKADCLRALHRSFIEEELERLEAAVGKSTSAADAVRRIVRSFLYGVHQHHALARIFDHEWRHVQAEGFEDIRLKRDRIVEIVTEQIERGVADGQFIETASPNVLALGLIGMCGWAHRWYQPDGAMGFDEIANLWTSSFLDGILVRRTRRGRG